MTEAGFRCVNGHLWLRFFSEWDGRARCPHCGATRGWTRTR